MFDVFSRAEADKKDLLVSGRVSSAQQVIWRDVAVNDASVAQLTHTAENLLQVFSAKRSVRFFTFRRVDYGFSARVCRYSIHEFVRKVVRFIRDCAIVELSKYIHFYILYINV